MNIQQTNENLLLRQKKQIEDLEDLLFIFTKKTILSFFYLNKNETEIINDSVRNLIDLTAAK
jgi:hypothetical protein